MNPLTTLAQDVAVPTSPTTTLGIAGIIIAAVTAVWSWFRSELNDCKKDRKDLYARVDSLHSEVSALSLRVGNVERPKT